MTNSNIIPLRDQSVIDEEAALWVVRLQEGDVSSEQMAEFQAWYAKSVQHKDAFERLASFSGGLEFLETLEDYAESDALKKPLRQDRIARWYAKPKRILVGSIAAVLVICAGFAAQYAATLNTPGFEGAYQTAIGGQETIALPDGSQIVLNTDSAVDVAFVRDARSIRLVRGEAYFEVAKDPARPFSVQTDKGTVTAVGTAFSVRLHDEKLDVVVTEGRVALEAIQLAARPSTLQQAVTPPRAQKREVSAGQSAVLDQGVEEISVVQPEAMEKALDWQDGELSFRGETLEEVISDISRYTDLDIEIAGDDLKQQQIVARYRVGDIDRMFEALHIMADVEVERLPENRVRLYREN